MFPSTDIHVCPSSRTTLFAMSEGHKLPIQDTVRSKEAISRIGLELVIWTLYPKESIGVKHATVRQHVPAAGARYLSRSLPLLDGALDLGYFARDRLPPRTNVALSGSYLPRASEHISFLHNTNRNQKVSADYN